MIYYNIKRGAEYSWGKAEYSSLYIYTITIYINISNITNPW